VGDLDHRAAPDRGRCCVYTALLNGYEQLTEQPVRRESGVDFLCFTDDPSLTSDTWDLRLVTPLLPADPARSQRYLKIRADRVLPEYDVSLYIDNSVLLRVPPEDLIAALLPPGRDLAAVSHSFQTTVKGEFAAVVEWELDAPSRCEEQEAHYALTDAALLELRPLWSGLMVRRHHSAAIVAAMETWYTHVLRYSRRDQLSVWCGLRAAGVEPVVHDLDNHESPYHVWPVSVGRDRRRAGVPWRVEIEQEARRARRLSDELAVLTSSKSWRWTAPLRATRRRLTQLRAGTA